MTQNRARKSATAKLAATENIPHREAAYLTDHRKLKLADGTIHDFSTGPLRYLGLPGNGQAHVTVEALKEARAKGWIVTRALSGQPSLRSAMADTRPGLIILHVMSELGVAPHPLTEEIEAGLHSNLNILVIREPKPGEHRKEPASGRNIHLPTASETAAIADTARYTVTPPRSGSTVQHDAQVWTPESYTEHKKRLEVALGDPEVVRNARALTPIYKLPHR